MMFDNVPVLIDLWIHAIPNIAMTTSSLSISKDPRAMKYIDVRMSPGCIRVSPGGACVDLNCIDKARRHPEMEGYTGVYRGIPIFLFFIFFYPKHRL